MILTLNINEYIERLYKYITIKCITEMEKRIIRNNSDDINKNI